MKIERQRVSTALTVSAFIVVDENVFGQLLTSLTLHSQQSGVHKNGWYVCNALMQIDVFPLELRNDVL